jgi:hypothetical protein
MEKGKEEKREVTLTSSDFPEAVGTPTPKSHVARQLECCKSCSISLLAILLAATFAPK